MLDNFFSALDFISGILVNRFLQFLVIGGSSMLHGLVHLNIIVNDISPSIYFKSPTVEESENSGHEYLLVVSRRSPIISETVLSRQQCAKSWHICRKVFLLLLQSCVQTYLVKKIFIQIVTWCCPHLLELLYREWRQHLCWVWSEQYHLSQHRVPCCTLCQFLTWVYEHSQSHTCMAS